ncbi:MAG: alpha/beta hydrolase [Nevskia sp.]|nr:alpha/beta hydrolase [Nevskia sp.]
MSQQFHPPSGLSYRIEGQGPTLLLLHANPGDSRDFDAVAPQLARRFRVIRPDWPGYGGSPAPQPPGAAGAGLFLQRFEALMDGLEVSSAHLLGNSVGANVAAHYALRRPERVCSLVLVSPGGFTDHNALTRAVCRLQGQVWFKRLLGSGFTRWYLRERNDWTRAMIARAGGEQAGAAALAVNAAVWRSFIEPRHDLRQAAAALRVPTLVMSGKRDPVLPAHTDGRNAARAIPGARQVVLDCGHALFAELPEPFLAEAGAFWDALERDGAAPAGVSRAA